MAFLVELDFFMHQIKKGEGGGGGGQDRIQWSLTQYLKDLGFADDLYLMVQCTSTHKQKQTDWRTRLLWLFTNLSKTDLMKMNNQQEESVISNISRQTRINYRVNRRGHQSSTVTVKINVHFPHFKIGIELDLFLLGKNPCAFNSNVKWVLLHRSETLHVTSVIQQAARLYQQLPAEQRRSDGQKESKAGICGHEPTKGTSTSQPHKWVRANYISVHEPTT